jgi:hypothetical protein
MNLSGFIQLITLAVAEGSAQDVARLMQDPAVKTALDAVKPNEPQSEALLCHSRGARMWDRASTLFSGSSAASK